MQALETEELFQVDGLDIFLRGTGLVFPKTE